MKGIFRVCAVYFLVCCALPEQTVANNTTTEMTTTAATTTTPVSHRDVYKIDSVSPCVLLPVNEELSDEIAELEEKGVILLKYALSIQGYDINPLLVDIDYGYKGDRWHRVFNRHGEVLLTLTFNYDILSLSLLQFGVNSLDIELKDEPAGCLGTLDEKQKIVEVLKLLLRDFKSENETSHVLDGKNYACHQKIDVLENKKEVEFVHECCQHHEHSNSYICNEVESIKTITILYYFLFAIKVLFLLFGPLAVQDLMYPEPVKTLTYVVPLTEPAQEEISTTKARKRLPQGSNFPKHVKMSFNKLHVSVDHSLLISEKKVPVGLIRFFVDNFLKCKITYTDAFDKCCAQSILGNWTRYFMCIPLRAQEFVWNTKLKKVFAWRHIFLFLGSLISLALVSLPFIIRIVLYYEFEEDEIVSRREAVSELGYDLADAHNIFQKLSPTNGLLIFAYVCYFSSFLALAMLRKFCRDELDAIVLPALEDMREVSYIEGLKMVCERIVLPFEKFGLLGFVVALIYWPLILPLCIIVLLCYGFPILYLTGRFLIHKRPSFLQSAKKLWEEDIADDKKARRKQKMMHASRSLNTMFKLNNISPRNVVESSESLASNVSDDGEGSCTKLGKRAFPIVVGVICIINMYALVAMYAEIIGYVAEIIVLTFMGAIINASMAHKYIMLLFWILMYTTKCFNNVYVAYMKLNKKLFSFIKSKLYNEVKGVTLQDASIQKNTAFKYFTMEEIDQLREKYPAFQAKEKRVDTLVETKKGVFWDVRSLVLFVDKNDVPRISRKLFFEICEKELEGCPGPVYKSLAQATKHLLYMVFFLIFVFLVILSFGSIYELSSTNQLLLTLAGGFLPTIIRFVIQPHITIDIDLNTYTFDGKIQQILFEFSQKWPVTILKGDRLDDGGRNSHQDDIIDGVPDNEHLTLVEDN